MWYKSGQKDETHPDASASVLFRLFLFVLSKSSMMRGLIRNSALLVVLSAISCSLVEACTPGSSLGAVVRPPSAIVKPLCFHGMRLRLRGGSEGGEEAREAGTDPCPGDPTPTKSRAKALRKAAEKDLKKRPEPDGIKAVEEGAGCKHSPLSSAVA
jgi:hypothetical protein